MGQELAGVPITRLCEIAGRHAAALEAGECIALSALASDDSISPVNFVAFMRWRAIGSLRAACGNEPGTFTVTLAAAAQLERSGRL